MPIKSYIPPTKKIIDHRSPSGGYYTANCDVCGTEFFPARRNAKYCSPNCGVVAHRTALANGTAEKKTESKSKKEKTSTGVVLVGSKKVFEYLSQHYDTNRQKGVIVNSVKSLELGQSFNFGPASIKRISAGKFEVI